MIELRDANSVSAKVEPQVETRSREGANMRGSEVPFRPKQNFPPLVIVATGINPKCRKYAPVVCAGMWFFPRKVAAASS
jgi:hypothetical protein